MWSTGGTSLFAVNGCWKPGDKAGGKGGGGECEVEKQLSAWGTLLSCPCPHSRAHAHTHTEFSH